LEVSDVRVTNTLVLVNMRFSKADPVTGGGGERREHVMKVKNGNKEHTD
jgi:hypothetical protein